MCFAQELLRLAETAASARRKTRHRTERLVASALRAFVAVTSTCRWAHISNIDTDRLRSARVTKILQLQMCYIDYDYIVYTGVGNICGHNNTLSVIPGLQGSSCAQ